ncbi:NAD-dependent epimerase/dehydratase family protein [Rhizobium rhizogenes]|uniref:NAD-dependent epimerase/dehydratase family protein n=1 Tax=Rhizobium rhizogenes TaxID=359 RepID=UPI0005A9EF67|nr:NAD-dependent epimerase/dehydratase family protein [Rhizobium rhizogenes]NTG68847.1 NAD-dependent epimerase/dehydratase family protein [Rhizobium rhizogenes]NTH53026.1 NAD-dependent epimerase/dehydratase family protein [Rhizobium rhizogenes]NTH72610.1 NAD-dependent epimerase/dehydratase family protein [Rhizobium rhizogenes]NTI69655.1 NAD-dependent epimerase/dehydratase family protein [Rhizobium rhizogenes]TRB04551.1 NAD-dependent epimerase/dehydratase family protein [Rhizobium rhizogenes]
MTSHVIFGGAGFIGRHVARALIARGEDVTVVVRSAYPASAGIKQPKVVMPNLSTAVASDFDRLIGDAEIVHNYAWSTIPQTANAEPLEDLVDNVGLTINILEAMRRRGGGRLIFTSSGGTVYGRLHTIPVPETHELAPLTAYGASKVSAETYIKFYNRLYGLDTRIARVANPYGAGQMVTRPQGVLTTMVHRALSHQTIEIWGDGEVVRDFIHVSDAVSGLLSLADALPNQDLVPPIFNIGSGKGCSINEILVSIERRLEKKLQVVRKPGRAFDIPISVLDIAKMEREFGWRPKLTLEAGIYHMLDDLQEDPARLFSSLI